MCGASIHIWPIHPVTHLIKDFESTICILKCHWVEVNYQNLWYSGMLYFCLTLRTTVTSACISEEDACHHTCNLRVFSRVQKGTPGLTHKGCVMQRVSLNVLSDVTVVLGMRSIGIFFSWTIHSWVIWYFQNRAVIIECLLSNMAMRFELVPFSGSQFVSIITL